MNVVLIGFGNIAHSIIANNIDKDINISVMSNSVLQGEYIINNEINGTNGSALVVNNYEVLSKADYIIFCVPSYIRRKVISDIAPYVSSDVVLGAFPGVSGFNEEVRNLASNVKYYFSSQRVPFISRIVEKGRRVNSFKKNSLEIAVSCDQERIIKDVTKILSIKVSLLRDFDLVNLTNSNPLLHTSRIYEYMLKVGRPFEISTDEKFYEDWTESASNILIKMDIEFQKIMRKLNLNTNSILKHYGVSDSKELTEKLRNIDAFKGIKFPMINEGNKNFVDLKSRYLIEDFDFGLRYIYKRAKILGIETPMIERVLFFYDSI